MNSRFRRGLVTAFSIMGVAVVLSTCTLTPNLQPNFDPDARDYVIARSFGQLVCDGSTTRISTSVHISLPSNLLIVPPSRGTIRYFDYFDGLEYAIVFRPRKRHECYSIGSLQ